ncbi:MAG: hypothetical protein FJW30_10620 [Acidobacteria bacterium]|nr:hypothetical protein [Acidobacteriota bacterium]
MSYAAWLTGLSFLFFAVERLWPGRQPERKSWGTDLIHIVVNSHAWGVLIALTVGRYVPSWDTGFAAGWPMAAQAGALIAVQDFAQW